MSTLFFTMSGAAVSVYPACQSATVTFQITLPLRASSARRWPSSVAQKTRSPRTATPRLTTSQQSIADMFSGRSASYIQRSVPVFASSAKSLLQADVMYMTPLLTTGIPSWPPSTPIENAQAGASLLTLVVSICLSGVNQVAA